MDTLSDTVHQVIVDLACTVNERKDTMREQTTPQPQPAPPPEPQTDDDDDQS